MDWSFVKIYVVVWISPAFRNQLQSFCTFPIIPHPFHLSSIPQLSILCLSLTYFSHASDALPAKNSVKREYINNAYEGFWHKRPIHSFWLLQFGLFHSHYWPWQHLCLSRLVKSWVGPSVFLLPFPEPECSGSTPFCLGLICDFFEARQTYKFQWGLRLSLEQS